MIRLRFDSALVKNIHAMPLHELRHARQMTQETVAKALGTTQGSVSKLERRTDIYVSVLV